MHNSHIAVLGPIPHDHITTHRGEIIEKYGGVNNPVIGIARLLGDQGTVYPVSHVRKRDYEPCIEILKPYENIDPQNIRCEADMGDLIRLEFLNQNKRIEKQTGMMNPIMPEDVKGLLHCDVFVCVPITDFEIPMDTIRFLRENSKGTIIFDAHGPTNTLAMNGDRIMRFWADRDAWLPYVDVLKMNLEESHACWFKPEFNIKDFENYDFENRSHLRPFAEHVLKKGPKAVIVTLDSSGCVLFEVEDGQVVEKFVHSVKVDHVVDTTGCGDSFAGGLGYGLLTHPGDYEKAIQYAHALGAMRTQGTTFEVFKSKEVADEMISRTYG